MYTPANPNFSGGGRVVRRCWVNLQCRGVLLVWMIVGQGLIALAVDSGWGCFDIFSLIYLFSLWPDIDLKYHLKGPLNPKQPTNQPTFSYMKTDLAGYSFHRLAILRVHHVRNGKY